MNEKNTDRAWIEIDLDNLEHNARVLQAAMPPRCRLMAVVKANAYGHGAVPVSARLNKIGVEVFAVATIDEGIELRRHGIRGEILIFGYTGVSRAQELKEFDLTQTLISFEYAQALNAQGIPVKTHIKIDTGMHRLGMAWDDPERVKQVFSMVNISVNGMYTHLCSADSRLPEDAAFTEEQLRRFCSLIENLKSSGVTIPRLHTQSSYGLLNYPGLTFDYARMGIALYGVLSTPDTNTAQKLDLRPVLRINARVVLIRSVPKGESVGYSRTFTAERDSKIAILPIGYADGIPRSLSGGKGSALIHGQRVPIVGRVCMDQLAVDITDAENIRVGDVATLVGDSLSVPTVAEETGSISNELLSRLGSRLPIVEK